jgi:chromatin remodeling complex protein RSC6
MAKKAAKKSTKKASKKTASRGGARKAAGARKAGASRKGAAKGAAKGGARKAAKAGRKTKRTPNAAFMRPVEISETLAPVVGAKPIPRTEVTKRLWAYIRKNGLQDTKNRRQINADAALKPVFGGKASVSMFDMTKLVNRHLS